MKKIILLCTALVVALGGLGIGYAMWYDSLHVVGNVSTGCVGGAGSFTVKNTFGYKALKTLTEAVDGVAASVNEPFFKQVESTNLGTKLDPPVIGGTNGSVYVGGVKATVVDKTITLFFDKAFPAYNADGTKYDLAAIITYKYSGDCTIPIHLDVRNITDPCDVLTVNTGKNATEKGGTDPIRTEWSVFDDQASPVQVGSTKIRTLKDLKTDNPLEGLQLHQNYSVQIKIYLDSDALQEADKMAKDSGKTVQGLTGELAGRPCTFSFDLIAHQWNETYDKIPLPKTIAP